MTSQHVRAHTGHTLPEVADMLEPHEEPTTTGIASWLHNGPVLCWYQMRHRDKSGHLFRLCGAKYIVNLTGLKKNPRFISFSVIISPHLKALIETVN